MSKKLSSNHSLKTSISLRDQEEPQEIQISPASTSELSKFSKTNSSSETYKTTDLESEMTMTNPSSTDEKKINTPLGKPLIELQISFFEIPREILNQWTQESQLNEQLQNHSEYVAGQISKDSSLYHFNFKVLKKELKKMPLRKQENLIFGKTNETSSEFIGIQAQFEVKSFENQLAKVYLNLIKSLPSEKIELPIDFEINKKEMFYLLWKSALVGFENEPSLWDTPPIHIMKSQNYLNQKTDFLITIESI